MSSMFKWILCCHKRLYLLPFPLKNNVKHTRIDLEHLSPKRFKFSRIRKMLDSQGQHCQHLLWKKKRSTWYGIFSYTIYVNDCKCTKERCTMGVLCMETRLPKNILVDHQFPDTDIVIWGVYMCVPYFQTYPYHKTHYQLSTIHRLSIYYPFVCTLPHLLSSGNLRVCYGNGSLEFHNLPAIFMVIFS